MKRQTEQLIRPEPSAPAPTPASVGALPLSPQSVWQLQRSAGNAAALAGPRSVRAAVLARDLLFGGVA